MKYEKYKKYKSTNGRAGGGGPAGWGASPHSHICFCIFLGKCQFIRFPYQLQPTTFPLPFLPLGPAATRPGGKGGGGV